MSKKESPLTLQEQQATIQHLATLPPLEYDQKREGAAKDLGVRVATIDKLVTEKRKEGKENDDGGIEDIVPWHDPVNLLPLLNEISAIVQRFIVCQRETAHAMALWAAMTWFIDVVQVAPLAVITAPEKRCGKSQLLFLLSRVVARPLMASNISPAALYRAIEAWQPTLLVDEADSFMKDNEPLRGVLNSGHTREAAYVVRVEGESHTPKRFSTWGAKALAGIGSLAGTLMDRAIILELRRKLPHEEVDRLRHAEPGLFDELAAKLARFAKDNKEAVRLARPELPPTLNDRAQDNWEPLLAIADVAGGDWPALARSAALKLSTGNDQDLTIGAELLSDIQEVLKMLLVDRISTSDLIESLCEDDEKPWASYNKGNPISPRQIATRLKGYGIKSATIRFTSTTAKGYMLVSFEEAFARYLAPPSHVSSVTPSQPRQDKGSPVTEVEVVTVTSEQKVTPKLLWDKGCYPVTDRKRGARSNIVKVEI